MVTLAFHPATLVDPSLTAFYIIIAVLFGVVGVVLIAKSVTFNFGNGEVNEYTRLLDGPSGRENVPHEYLNDEEALTHLAEEYDLSGVSPEELSAYRLGEEFTLAHPRKFHHYKGGAFSPEDLSLIKEKGIEAFEFEQQSADNLLNAKYIVADKTDLLFQNNSEPYSTATAVLNFPLPVKNRTHADTIYFETKIYEFDNTVPNAHFSIGLVTKPYPSEFRLPGYNKFSIAYESTGNLKINKPLPTPLQQHMGEDSKFNAQVLPPLQQSDVVGIGYVIPSGTLFITRNGKKVLDVMSGLFLDLYPAIGCFLTNGRFQVNIGQLGFVWVEANVKKYAFVSTSDYRKIRGEQGMVALPDYGTLLLEDTVLAKGEELPPDYPEDELDFFGRSIRATTSAAAGTSTTEESSKANESSQLQKLNEKVDVEGSFSQITHDPEEIMDLRERIYEQTIANDESSSVLAPVNDKPQDEFADSLLVAEESEGSTSLSTAPHVVAVAEQVESATPQAAREDSPVTKAVTPAAEESQAVSPESASSPDGDGNASNTEIQPTDNITSNENTPEPSASAPTSSTKAKSSSTNKKKKKKGKSTKKKGKKK